MESITKPQVWIIEKLSAGQKLQVKAKKRLYQRSTDDHVVLDVAAQMCLVKQQTSLKFGTTNGDGKEDDEGDLLRFTTVNKGGICFLKNTFLSIFFKTNKTSIRYNKVHWSQPSDLGVMIIFPLNGSHYDEPCELMPHWFYLNFSALQGWQRLTTTVVC